VNTTLNWQEPEAADALCAERRWANKAGDLSPSSELTPGYPRLALIHQGRVILEGEPLEVAA
jgi:hypothetical protein